MPENTALSRVADILRTEADLDKLEIITKSLEGEKSGVDSQIQIEQERGLDNVQLMIGRMQLANKHLKELKSNVDKLDKLQHDSDIDSPASSLFDKSATVLTNFNNTFEILQGFKNLSKKMSLCEELMAIEVPQDSDYYKETSSGDNLLLIHYNLNELRDFRDKVEAMSVNSPPDEKQALAKAFSNLDRLVKRFDWMIGLVVDEFIDIVTCENYGLLIKLARIIQYEDREDAKVRLLNELMQSSDAKGLKTKVSRTSPHHFREHFEKAFQDTVKSSFDTLSHDKQYENVIQVLDENYYETMAVYKGAIDKCFPKEWKFFDKVLRWNQFGLQEVFSPAVDDESVSNATIVQVLNFEYSNRKKIRELFGVSLANAKKMSILPEAKHQQLLDSCIKFNETKTDEWVRNSLQPAVDLFETRSKEPPDSKDEKLGIETAQTIIEILKSNVHSLLDLGDSKALLQYLEYFATEVMQDYYDTWSTTLNQEVVKWTEPAEGDEDPTIGYMPRYITVLANDCVKLTDGLDSEFKSLSQFLHESFHEQLGQVGDEAGTHAIQLGTDCLTKLTDFTAFEYKPYLAENFSKSWYKSSSNVEYSLQIIEESYMAPLKEYLHPELYASLFEMVFDKFLLIYLEALYAGRKIKEDKFADKVERDGNQIQRVFSKYDPADIVENQLYILDVLINLATAKGLDDYVEQWQTAIDVFNDLPTDFIKVILENKGMRDSKVRNVVEECAKVSSALPEVTPTFMAGFAEPI